MDDGMRRSKGGRRSRGISESRIISERRPLFSIQLAPPDYDVPPHILTDSYIEKEVRFAGIVSDVSKYVDATNRTDVLREIDRGKREKCVCWKTTFEEDAIFSLSVHNIKISRRDGDEKLLLRLAVHEVEAMSYIRDDDQHILCIKFAIDDFADERDSDSSGESSQLAVLYCDSRGSSEELCSMLNQCFQLVYTNNTMHFFDDKVNEAAAGMSLSSSTVKSESMSNSKSRTESGYESKTLGFLSQSTTDLVNNPGTLSSTRSRSLPRRPSNAQSNHSNNLSSDNEQLLQDYTRKLYDRLNVNELRQFAILVKAWHNNMPFSEFCDQVLQLYGPDRKHLIIGMRPFIPEKDLAQFESFLERVGLQYATATGNGTLSSGLNSRVFRSSFSTPSTNAGAAAAATGTGTEHPDDYDKMLNTISSRIDNLGVSSGSESQYLSGNT